MSRVEHWNDTAQALPERHVPPHRATCGALQAPAEDGPMICGTHEELDARLSGEDVPLCVACC